MRLKEDYDGAEPSVDSVSCLNLLRLAGLTGIANFTEKAEKILMGHYAQLQKSPFGVPQLLVALDW